MTNINLRLSSGSVMGAIKLVTSANKWSEDEGRGGNGIFKTKNGDFVYVVDGNFVKLKGDAGEQVGTLNDLNPAAMTDSGSGYAVESATDFRWSKA